MSFLKQFNTVEEINNLNLPDPKWIVQDYLLEGGISILAGDAKAGKSTLARQIIAAVSAGQNFLNKKTTQVPVLYFCLEDRLKFVANSLTALDANINEIVIVDKRVPTWNIVLEEIKEKYKSNTCLIVLDTLGLNVELTDLNDYSKVTKALTLFKDFAKDTNAHILMLHHLGKDKERSNQNQMIGSTALSGIVESMLFISKTDSGANFNTTVRYGETIKDLMLDFDTQSEQFSISTNQKLPVIENISTYKSRILDCIKNLGGRASRSEIQRGVIGKSAHIVGELNKLVQENVLIFKGTGLRGDPKIYEPVIGSQTAGNGEQEQHSQTVASDSTVTPDITSQGYPEPTKNSYNTGGSNV